MDDGIKTFHVSEAGGLLRKADMDAEKIKIIGNLNGDDIRCIRDMSNLSYLDISLATIVEGGDCFLEYHKSRFTSNNSISDYMFYNLRNLSFVRLPDNIEIVGKHIFKGCSNLSYIITGKNIKKISRDAFIDFCGQSFDYKGLTSLIIGNNVAEISDSAFKGCCDIEAVFISNKVTNIGNYAFAGCISLNAITIPDSVEKIGERAFFNCAKLKSVVIGEKVRTIGDYAFYYCTDLTEVHIKADEISQIGKNVFERGENLFITTLPYYSLYFSK
jgi:hypothetical protein